MKTFKSKLFAVLLGIMVPILTANCSDKKSAGKVEAAEPATETESVIKMALPPFQKFVVVTDEDTGLYQKADRNSPHLVRWIEADCESDLCESIYQWSDQPGKSGFELSTEILTWEGRVLPVLGDEGQFYKVCIIGEWCDIESAYISKDCVGDIETAAINADMLESEDNYATCCVIKDGKYKDIVLMDEFDELNGETLKAGILKDGVVAIPAVFQIDCQMFGESAQSTEKIKIEEVDGILLLRYDKSLSVRAEDGYEAYQLDPKKLSSDQVVKIVEKLTAKKPEYVNYMYHFPAQGLESFYYKVK